MLFLRRQESYEVDLIKIPTLMGMK